MYEKALWIFEKACKKNNYFFKKNEIINKRAAGIIEKWKNCYISQEKNWKQTFERRKIS